MASKQPSPIRARAIAVTGSLIALLGIVPAAIAVAAAAPAIVQAVNSWRLTRHTEFLENGTTRAEEVDLVSIVRIAEMQGIAAMPDYFDPIGIFLIRWLGLPIEAYHGYGRVSVSVVAWAMASLLLLSIALAAQHRFLRPDYSQDLRDRRVMIDVYCTAVSRAVGRAFGTALLIGLAVASAVFIGGPALLSTEAYPDWVARLGSTGLLVFVALLPWTVVLETRRAIRAAITAKDRRCTRCSYPVAGNEGRCPECGLVDAKASEREARRIAKAVLPRRRWWRRPLTLIAIGLFALNLATWLPGGHAANLCFVRVPTPDWVLRLPIDTWTELSLGDDKTYLVRVDRYTGEQGGFGTHIRRFTVRCLMDGSRPDFPFEDDGKHDVLASGGVVPELGSAMFFGIYHVQVTPDITLGRRHEMVCITSRVMPPPRRIRRLQEPPPGRIADVFARVDWSPFERPPVANWVSPAPIPAQDLIDWALGRFPATKPAPW